jgi:putative ribosome biogenesis GTPase RsgA
MADVEIGHHRCHFQQGPVLHGIGIGNVAFATDEVSRRNTQAGKHGTVHAEALHVGITIIEEPGVEHEHGGDTPVVGRFQRLQAAAGVTCIICCTRAYRQE